MNEYIQLARVRGNINLEYIQIARVLGHPNTKSEDMHKDDFYTLCMKNPSNNIGLRKYNIRDQMPVFKTNDISLDYLCSDFVRFCLSIYKNNQHIDNGNMQMIPKYHIPLSKELEEYIKEFLPDYYDIRK